LKHAVIYQSGNLRICQWSLEAHSSSEPQLMRLQLLANT